MQPNILVVDDDLGILHAIRITLEDEGYHVVAAENGQIALEIVADTPPNLILLDMMMPKMDGSAFARELERRNLKDSIPIVLLTAGGRARQLADAIGATTYLQKPFDIDDLLGVVESLAGPSATPHMSGNL